MTAEDQVRDLLLPQFRVGDELLKAKRAPTTDGYYWFKGSIEGRKPDNWHIVFHDGSMGRAYITVTGMDMTYDTVDCEGLFIGPLSKPTN